MQLILLCNAGLALVSGGQTLLVDVPAGEAPPFAPLPPEIWRRILERDGDYRRLAGLWFTHTHPDHCDLDALAAFQRRWPEVPCLMPQAGERHGIVELGGFALEYAEIPHAPIPNPPVHRVTWIEAEGRSVYVAADAALDVEAHRAFLRGRRAGDAFFNAMYLSRPETRALLREAADRVWIYHMPPDQSDGIWRKCRRNLERFAPELTTVTVLDRYPSAIPL